MPLVATDRADGISKFDIPTSYSMAASVGFAIVVKVMYAVLSTMFLEMVVNDSKLGIDVLGCILIIAEGSLFDDGL